MNGSGKPVRIVLTGGIGSGKSTAARILADLGAEVIDADRIGHEVLEGPAFEAVRRRWPSAVVDGAVDRARLAGIVFSDESELRELESITHPLIRREISRKVSEVPADRPVVVEISVPVGLVEGQWTIVVVDAPEGARRSRLLERGMARTDIERRLEAQPDRSTWLDMADRVIVNTGTQRDLRTRLTGLLRDLGVDSL